MSDQISRLRCVTTGSDPDLARLVELFGRGATDVAPPHWIQLEHGVSYHVGTAARVLTPDFAETRSGLLVPKGAELGPGPLDNFALYATWEEATGQSVGLDEITDVVGRIHRDNLLVLIARFLGIHRGSPHLWADIERELVTAGFPNAPFAPALLTQINQGHRLVTPQALMVLAKLSIAHGSNGGAPANDTAFASLALLCLMLQSVFYRHGDDDDPHLRMDVAANAWHNRPVHIPELLSLLEERWISTSVDSRSSLADTFQSSMGFDLEVLAGSGVLLWMSVREGHVPLNRDWVAPAIEQVPELEAAIRAISKPVVEFEDLVRDEVSTPSRLEWDFSAFEQFPVIELEDGRLLILDEIRLVRRCMGWAPVYDAIGQLPPSERNRVRHDVARVCEQHALDQLRRMYPDHPTKRLFDAQELEMAYAASKSKVADAAVDCGDTWLAIEITSLIAKREALIGQGSEHYSQMLEQVVAEAAQALATAHSLITDAERLCGVPVSPDAVFPIVLLTEAFPVLPTTQSEIRDRISASNPSLDPRIRPVELLSLHDLRFIEVLTKNHGLSIPSLIAAKSESAFWADSMTSYLRAVHAAEWPDGEKFAHGWEKLIDRFYSRLSSAPDD